MKTETFHIKVPNLMNLSLTITVGTELNFWIKEVKSLLFSPHECPTQ